MRISVGLSVISLFLITACCDDDPVISAGYPDDVDQIIVSSCAIDDCHKGPNSPEGLDLSSWDLAFNGSDFGAILIPYDAQWSHLFQHLNTFEDLGIRATPVMPVAPAETLSRTDVLTIKEWIERGAPDKNGRLRWQAEEEKNTGKLFALAAGSDLVAVADLASNLVMRVVPVGASEGELEAPHYIRISPDKAFFYVTLIRGTAVEKYRTDTYEKVGRVIIGPDPALIQLNEDGSRMVISHYNNTGGSPKLTLIDAQSMEVLDELIGGGDLLSFPHGMAAPADFSKIYVVAGQGNYYAKVLIENDQFVPPIDQVLVDPANTFFPQASVAYKPYHCYLDATNNRFFVSCSETDEVRIFDTNSDSLIAAIPTGEFPRLMDYDPIDQRLFVACANESNPAQGSRKGCVSVIDVNQNQLLQNIYNLGHRPHGVSIDQQTRRLFVSSENTGGIDPPHHPTTDVGPPGKYNIVDLTTLEVLTGEETEIPVFPNALVVNR